MTETWDVPDPAAGRLRALVEAVRRSPHNLMSPRGLDELESRHVPECLALARMLPDAPHRVLDVGSGGGFPGLVIAAARPDLEVSLVEATGKKADFLREAAANMGVAAEVHHGRAETLTGALGGRFDTVTARAVAPLPRLLGWTIPFLRADGRLYAMKGERWPQELRDAQSELRRLGARVVSTPPTGQPEDPWEPRVVIIAAAP